MVKLLVQTQLKKKNIINIPNGKSWGYGCSIMSIISLAFLFLKERRESMANPVKKLEDLTANYSNEFKAQRKEAEEALFNYSQLTTKPPNWLPRSSLTEWERVIPLLKKDFPISEADYSLLVSYVLLYARIMTCENEIKKSGTFILNKKTNVKRANPAVSMQSQAIRDMRSIATSLGMTLESRQRLAITKAKKEKPTDPFERLLNDS